MSTFPNLKQFFFSFSKAQSKLDIYHKDIHFENEGFLSTAQKGTVFKQTQRIRQVNILVCSFSDSVTFTEHYGSDD